MDDEILKLEDRDKQTPGTWWGAIGWFVGGAVTASAIIFGVCLWQGLQGIMKNPYAVWQTAEMVVAYMEKHENRWPRSWKDLEGTMEAASLQSHTAFNIELLQEFVVIDWNADPKQLSKATLRDDDQPPFRVIWLRSGRTSYVTGSEPNRIIWNYLTLGRMRPR